MGYTVGTRIACSSCVFGDMFPRNLVAERESKHEQRAAKSRRCGNEETFELIEAMPFSPAEHATMLVDITDELADRVVNASSDKSSRVVSNSLGVYFNTGRCVGDKAVSKQIDTIEGMERMYIFFAEGGWWCSTRLFECRPRHRSSDCSAGLRCAGLQHFQSS